MRTIKFRAWNNKDKEMFIPIGYSFIDGNLTCIIEDKKTMQNKVTEHIDETWYEHGRKPEYSNGKSNIELMQFTGLTDKNGVEIYEGDIVKTSHRGHQSTNIIYWEESKYQSGNVHPYDDLNGFTNFGTWKYKNIEDNELTIAMYENCCEVIGNIYETPDQLKD